jgi:hypothetical protein
MKVVVAQSFQVADAGVVYRPGHVADVPDDVAQHWIQSVWVVRDTSAARKSCRRDDERIRDESSETIVDSARARSSGAAIIHETT